MRDSAALRNRIDTNRTETLPDAAVQLRRLVVMAEQTPRPHALLAAPNVCGLVASVLAVVERETARDGRGRDAVLLAVERWYDFPEFGGYLGNVGSNLVSPIRDSGY